MFNPILAKLRRKSLMGVMDSRLKVFFDKKKVAEGKIA